VLSRSQFLGLELKMAEIKHIGEPYSSDEKELPVYDVGDIGNGIIVENVDDLKRRLSGRQIQMITIGGSIGTALFVSIGSGLVQGGPGSLFIAFVLYCFFLAAVNNCMAEMAVFMPVSGSFIRMGSKWIDEAFGFMLGWNFFLYGKPPEYETNAAILIPIAEAVLIPWEISALNLVLTFWRDDIPLAAVCAGCIVLYG
jgi:yeast amino acid transporter